jgi:hypothetical protein
MSKTKKYKLSQFKSQLNLQKKKGVCQKITATLDLQINSLQDGRIQSVRFAHRRVEVLLYGKSPVPFRILG